MKHTLSTDFLKRNQKKELQVEYKQICQKKGVLANPKILKELKKREIKVNLNHLSCSDLQDWQGVEDLLRESCSMGVILHDLSLCKGSAILARDKQRPSPKIDTLINKQSKEKRLNAIFCSLSYNLSTNDQLIYLKIEHTLLSKSQLVSLSEGISSSHSLREVHLKECSLSSNDFQILSPSLSVNNSLYLLDLSHNHLTDASGQLLSNIMSAHAQRRDHAHYTSTLSTQQLGLLEYNLSYNQFTHRFVEHVHNIIRHDRWIKSLDFSHNQIERHGISVLLDTLYESSSLISLDIRENPGFSTNISNQILKFLLRNITTLQENQNICHSFQINNQKQQKYLINKIQDQSFQSQYGINNLRQILYENNRQQEQQQVSNFYNQKVQQKLSKSYNKSNDNLDSKIQKQYEQLNIIHENLKMKQVLQKIQFQFQGESAQDIQQFINKELNNYEEIQNADGNQKIDFEHQDQLMSQIELQMSELTNKMSPQKEMTN